MRSTQNTKNGFSLFGILQDPLVHFLVLGLILYIALSRMSSQNDTRVITVDEAALLTYMQYSSRAFDQEAALQTYKTLSVAGHARLVRDYIEEEALYREAKKLGLEQGDYILRKRMVQKFDYMAEASLALPTPSREELQEFYNKNHADFSTPAKASFTHLFFRSDGTSHQINRANAVLSKVKTLTITEALQQYGDTFLYQQSYTKRSREQISEIFGSDIANFILNDRTNIHEWFGPVSSPYGIHLLYITQKQNAYIEPFETVKHVIIDRMKRARIAEHKTAYVDAIIDDYTVKLAVTPPKKHQPDNGFSK